MMFGNERCKEIVENVCPYCGKVLLMNKRSFANHVRWCKANPKYEEILASTKSKISKSLKKESNIRKERILYCVVCGKEYTIICSNSELEKGKYRKTCSKECAHNLTCKNTNNELKNKKISNALSGRKYDKDKTSYEKLTDKKIVCLYCGKEFITRRSRKYCSQTCARRDRYSKNKDIKKEYKNKCNFIFALNEFPDEYDFSLVEKFGWYKAKNHGNNLNGVSRDHIFSCENGYNELIDPYLISHPANCQLLKHSDNSSKYTKSDISFDELLERIRIWHDKYGVYENKIDYTFFKRNNISFKEYNL